MKLDTRKGRIVLLLILIWLRWKLQVQVPFFPGYDLDLGGERGQIYPVYLISKPEVVQSLNFACG